MMSKASWFFVVFSCFFCGQSFASSSLNGRLDSCYDDYRRAQKCLPPFQNLAYNKEVTASHTCGTVPRMCCKQTKKGKMCSVCDSRIPNKSHPVKYLTDLHNLNNVTCWQADPIQSRKNVTLVLSLEKSYDITYISLQFCGVRPDSMAIYKSRDFGKSWKPYQFYSGDCKGMYTSSNKVSTSWDNEQEAMCTNAHLVKPLHGGMIAFSTLEGRPAANDIDKEPTLRDWVTATDIKFVFHRMNNSPTPKDTQFYAISDLSVGGRCQCNGHASRCLLGRDGSPTCDCKHHTAGPDCDRCKTFYNDRPWQAATSTSANECVACNCNLHAKVCEFNMELFRLSGFSSGGVCIRCRHNTAGRYCHYCKQGFFKDASKDITHPHVCRLCTCHPHGSTGKVCNQVSGQCPCKEGVVGRSCDQCVRGYQSTKNPVVPCIEIPHALMSTQPRDPACAQCRSRKISFTARRYCRKDYGARISVLGVDKNKGGDWIQVTVNVVKRFKRSLLRMPLGNKFLWIRRRNFKCKCPRLRPGNEYFIAGSIRPSRRKRGIVVDHRSLVFPWNDRLIEKLAKLQKRCQKMTKQVHRRMTRD